MARRWLLLGLLLAFMAGCVTRGVQRLPLLNDWPERQDILARVDDWSLRGRIGIRTLEEASSGNLSWQQRSRAFSAEIDGPLGIGGVRLEGTPDAVTLSGSKIETTTVTDPQTELAAQTGLQVPIGGLRYWLLGIPIPGQPADVTVNSDGVAEAIIQNGWAIRYVEYKRWSVNALPKRIVAESGDTKLTIIVRDWNIVEENSLPVE